MGLGVYLDWTIQLACTLFVESVFILPAVAGFIEPGFDLGGHLFCAVGVSR